MWTMSEVVVPLDFGCFQLAFMILPPNSIIENRYHQTLVHKMLPLKPMCPLEKKIVVSKSMVEIDGE